MGLVLTDCQLFRLAAYSILKEALLVAQAITYPIVFLFVSVFIEQHLQDFCVCPFQCIIQNREISGSKWEPHPLTILRIVTNYIFPLLSFLNPTHSLLISLFLFCLTQVCVAQIFILGLGDFINISAQAQVAVLICLFTIIMQIESIKSQASVPSEFCIFFCSPCLKKVSILF